MLLRYKISWFSLPYINNISHYSHNTYKKYLTHKPCYFFYNHKVLFIQLYHIKLISSSIYILTKRKYINTFCSWNNAILTLWCFIGSYWAFSLWERERRKSSVCFFGHNIISNSLYKAIRNNIGQKDNWTRSPFS